MSGWGAGVAGASRPRDGFVAQSYAPGAVVSEVARRHDMSPQHLFGWRNAARAGLLTLPADEVPMFVPIGIHPPGTALSNLGAEISVWL